MPYFTGFVALVVGCATFQAMKGALTKQLALQLQAINIGALSMAGYFVNEVNNNLW